MFGLTDESVFHQTVQCVGANVTLGDPGDHLDIPQAPGAVLDVRLKVICGFMVARVALILLFELGFKKIPGRPHRIGRNRLAHLIQQRPGSRQQARFHQGCDRHHLLSRSFTAFTGRAYAVPQIKPRIPKQLDKRLNFTAGYRISNVIVQQDQQINIRVGMQFPTPKAPDCNQADLIGGRDQALPCQ